MTESKHWDKHQIISDAFDAIDGTAARELNEGDKQTDARRIVGYATLLGAIVVQDLHRIANAQERIADATEKLAKRQYGK